MQRSERAERSERQGGRRRRTGPGGAEPVALAPAGARTFEGEDLQAVLADVMAALGPDASILAANKVRSGGVAGFFSRERFEVLAAPAGAAFHGVVPAQAPAPAVARAAGAPTRPGAPAEAGPDRRRPRPAPGAAPVPTGAPGRAVAPAVRTAAPASPVATAAPAPGPGRSDGGPNRAERLVAGGDHVHALLAIADAMEDRVQVVPRQAPPSPPVPSAEETFGEFLARAVASPDVIDLADRSSDERAALGDVLLDRLGIDRGPAVRPAVAPRSVRPARPVPSLTGPRGRAATIDAEAEPEIPRPPVPQIVVAHTREGRRLAKMLPAFQEVPRLTRAEAKAETEAALAGTPKPTRVAPDRPTLQPSAARAAAAASAADAVPAVAPVAAAPAPEVEGAIAAVDEVLLEMVAALAVDDVVTADPTTPWARMPAALLPEVSLPEQLMSEVSMPDVSMPEASAPVAAEPETATVEATTTAAVALASPIDEAPAVGTSEPLVLLDLTALLAASAPVRPVDGPTVPVVEEPLPVPSLDAPGVLLVVGDEGALARARALLVEAGRDAAEVVVAAPSRPADVRAWSWCRDAAEVTKRRSKWVARPDAVVVAVVVRPDEAGAAFAWDVVEAAAPDHVRLVVGDGDWEPLRDLADLVERA